MANLLRVINSDTDYNKIMQYRITHADSISISDSGVTQITATGFLVVEGTSRDGSPYNKILFTTANGDIYSTGSNAVIESILEIADLVTDQELQWSSGIPIVFAKKKSTLDSSRQYLTVNLSEEFFVDSPA